jgi:glycosyltransferase involved in cell wall biosynthesis
MLLYRSLVQRRDAKIPRRIICPSAAFAREIGDDYGVPPGRLDVVPNPVDLKRFHATEPWEPPSGPLRIRFISRIAVRKGVELVVELSHRLDDLAEQIHLDVVGGESLWSDYRPLLRRLNPRIASFDGGVWPDETAELYRSTDIFIQPSHYEPFALTVAEALASGVPVVVSDAVGAGEQVDRRCCRVFPAGDAAALEREVRALAIEMSQPDSARVLRQLAREEAERLFDPSKVARMIADVLQAARS